MAQVMVWNSVWPAPATARQQPAGLYTVGATRLPTDPLYLTDVEFQNAVVGSKLWMADANDTTRVIQAPMTISQANFTLTAMPAYSENMLAVIHIRETTYQWFRTFVQMRRTGATVYVAQVPEVVT